MSGALITVAALTGLLLGSFASVVIARVPTGGSILTPRSACPNCGHPVRPYDNIPVVSWLVLRGRCRDCAAPISVQYPLVEAVTGGLFAAVPVVFPHDPWLWPAAGFTALVAVILTVTDLRLGRLPDRVTFTAFPVLLALLTLAAWQTGQWGSLQTAVYGALAVCGFFAAAFLAYPQGMGFGDVKLAATVGLALGWFGWGPLAVGLFAAFLIAGIVSTVGLVRHVRRGGSRKGYSVPFGPFLFVGVAIGATVGGRLYDWYVKIAIGA